MAKKKVIPTKDISEGRRQPIVNVDPNGYLSETPKWAFKMCDMEHPKWAVKTSAFGEKILPKLASFEGLTWSEIQSASGGRSHGTNSHFEKVTDLIKEAQNRIIELNIHTDDVFSLRLSGTERLYGTLSDGIFNIIWYDPKHEVCPSVKKHT